MTYGTVTLNARIRSNAVVTASCRCASKGARLESRNQLVGCFRCYQRGHRRIDAKHLLSRQVPIQKRRKETKPQLMSPFSIGPTDDRTGQPMGLP